MSFCFKFEPRIRSVVAGFLLVASTGVSAFAQTCDCLVPISTVPAAQAVGQVKSITGQVNILGSGGWGSAKTGGLLYVGNRVETGLESSTSISVGKCTLDVGAQSTISIVPTEKALCVAVADTAPSINNASLIAVGAGLAVVGGVIAISTGDDSPASP